VDVVAGDLAVVIDRVRLKELPSRQRVNEAVEASASEAICLEESVARIPASESAKGSGYSLWKLAL
jgi:hypothetical protein